MVSKTTPMSCGALPRLTRAEAAERADARTRLAAAAEVLAEDQEAERAATTARKEAERALAAACDRVSALEKALAAAQRELDEAGRIPLVYHYHHGHHRQAQDPTLTGAEREAAWRPLPTGVAPAGRLCRTEHHPVVAGPAEHAKRLRPGQLGGIREHPGTPALVSREVSCRVVGCAWQASPCALRAEQVRHPLRRCQVPAPAADTGQHHDGAADRWWCLPARRPRGLL